MRLLLPEQLPQLCGPVLMIYRIAWPVLFLLGLVSVVYFSPATAIRDVGAFRAFHEAGVAVLVRGPKGQQIGPYTPKSRAAG